MAMADQAQLKLQIEGMHCAGCVASLEKGLQRLSGVSEARVNLATRSAAITYDPEDVDTDQIVRRIRSLGYDARSATPDLIDSSRREEDQALFRFQLAVILALPLMLLAMWPMWVGESLFGPAVDVVAQGALAALLLFVAGRSILADAVIQTRHFRANMNSLITLGSLTAFVWSTYVLISGWPTPTPAELYFESAGMIIALILLGRYLEARARGQAGDAISELVRLQPSRATIMVNGSPSEVEASSIMAGMEVLVKPGQRLPCDGRIMEGHPSIDESLLTGESIPIPKQPGDTVIGGSLNTNVPFHYKATAGIADSYLSQVIHLVAEAQARKAPVQRLADRVAGVFVPIVLLIAVATGLAWHFLAPGNPLLIKSVVSVLIIACPCALGLATPTAILAGSGRAARDGIVVRGGDILENLTRINTAILDKTGTLTHGHLEVAEVIELGEVSRMEFVRMVGSAEISSEHPLAEAIVKHMQENQIAPVSIRDIETTPGMGLSGKVGSQTLLVGNRALMNKHKVDIEPALERARQEMDKGRTVVMAALDGRLIGIIALADRLRSEARDVVAWMQERFRMVVMISGDTYQTTRGVARSLELEHFEAEVKPEQKQLVVEAYRKAGYRAVMIGDGVNDAPALAAADVGIAIGSGTDVAIQSAGVVVYGDDLHIIRKVFSVAEATMRVIKQNLFWAFFYNILAIPIAAGVLYPVYGLTLSPMIAATAMAFSSVFVVTNSLRLSRLQTESVSPPEAT